MPTSRILASLSEISLRVGHPAGGVSLRFLLSGQSIGQPLVSLGDAFSRIRPGTSSFGRGVLDVLGGLYLRTLRLGERFLSGDHARHSVDAALVRSVQIRLVTRRLASNIVKVVFSFSNCQRSFTTIQRC